MTTRNTMLNAILFLSIAIETMFNLGVKFGEYYRARGHRHLRTSAVYIIAGIIYGAETIRLGAAVLYNNRQHIYSAVNTYRNRIGQQFVYA